MSQRGQCIGRTAVKSYLLYLHVGIACIAEFLEKNRLVTYVWHSNNSLINGKLNESNSFTSFHSFNLLTMAWLARGEGTANKCHSFSHAVVLDLIQRQEKVFNHL